MKKMKNTKNPKRPMRYAAVAAGTAALLLWGCGQEAREPVIGLKTEAAGEDVQEEDLLKSETSKIQSHNISDLVDAPAAYSVQVTGKSIRLEGEADVQLPESDVIPARGFARKPHSRGMKEKWEELAEEAGLTDGILSFHSGAEGGEIPLFWVQSDSLAFGSSDHFDSKDLSGLTLSPEEKTRFEEQITSLGNQLIHDLGISGNDGEGLKLAELEWRGMQQKSADGGWESAGDYGISLTYQKTSDQIPIPQIPLSPEQGRSEYLQLGYTKEGKLLELKYIDCLELLERGEEEFLLPFASIAEIFEQYYKNEGLQTTASRPLLQEVEELPLVQVTEVCLEYMTSFEDGQAGASQDSGAAASASGKLLPVWNFYGLQKGQPIHLLSIDARDGRIWGR